MKDNIPYSVQQRSCGGSWLQKFSRVLVTGGAGFIGSHLVRRLLARGYSVVVLDNFRSGRIGNISECLKDENFKLVKGDVCDRKVVRNAMEDVDAVVHLAALIDVEESVNNPMETHHVNVDGTLNVLNEAVRSSAKKFLFASSTAVYGEGNPLPLKEDYPPKPISPYAASKAAAEHYCEAFHQCYKLPTVILRFFNVYGPRREYDSYSGVITKFVNNALEDKPLVIFGDGEQTRDFVHVEDAVSSIMLALEGANSVGEILNVCTGKPTSVNDLARTVKEVTGKSLHIIHGEPRKGDIRSNYGDPSKAEKILRFKAEVSLKKGLKHIVSGMQ